MAGRVVAQADVDDIGEQLIAQGVFGSVRVLRAQGQVVEDQDDDPVVRIRLTVSDPAGDTTTWPLDDVDRIQQEAERLAGVAESDLPYVVIELYPETPDDAEEASDGLDEDLSGELDRESGA